MAEKKKTEETFEDKEKRLDEIIARLENGTDLSLKETSLLYAEGKKLLGELEKELASLKDLVTNEIVSDK